MYCRINEIDILYEEITQRDKERERGRKGGREEQMNERMTEEEEPCRTQ